MNERIKQLAEDHGFIHDNMTIGEKSDALKKFEKTTELIVKKVFDSIADEGFEVYEPVVQKVKQSFGVEE